MPSTNTCPRVGRSKPHPRLHEGGLAGAIGADEGRDRAAGDTEVDARERGRRAAPVDLRDVVRFQRVVDHGHLCRKRDQDYESALLS